MRKKSLLNLVLVLLVLAIAAGSFIYARIASTKILAREIEPDSVAVEQMKLSEQENSPARNPAFQVSQTMIATPTPEPTPEPAPTPPPEPVFITGKYTDPQNGNKYLGYTLELPANAGGKLPVIVFLYGNQESNILNYGIVRKTQELYGPDFPFAILIPQTDQYYWEGWIPGTLCDMIDFLAKDNPLDADRIILTGHGRGGTGVWNAVMDCEGRFRAAVPISAAKDIRGEAFKNTPVWAMCGDGWYDRDNYQNWMSYLCEVVRKDGGEAQMTVVEGTAEAEITYLAFTQELFDWMLSK